MFPFLRRRESTGRTSSSGSGGGSRERLEEPSELLERHRRLLTGLRLESGYSAPHFAELIEGVILRYARLVHALPATQTEHHRERGGLLRFALECAFLAFRRADARILCTTASTETRRAHERAWRYGAFLAALCAPLGRVATHMLVTARQGELTWNPYGEALWTWITTHGLRDYAVRWRAARDAHPMDTASAWLSGGLLPPQTLRFLHQADPAALDALVKVVGGRRDNVLGELIEETAQAVIDRDLASADPITVNVSIEHKVIDALRGLVREKWTVNMPGGRVWITRAGTFLAWKPAVTDVQARLRAEGVTGVPQDPDTLAEILLEKGVLAKSPVPTALPHYHRILVHAPKLPRQPLEAVRVANPEALGLRTQGVEALEVEYVEASAENVESEGTRACAEPTHAELDVTPTPEEPVGTPKDVAGKTEPRSGTDSRRSAKSPSKPAPDEKADQAAEREQGAADTSRALERYGEAGRVLGELAADLAGTPSPAWIVPHEQGLALEYPGAVRAYTNDVRAFLESCRAQGLLVAQGGDATTLVWRASKTERELPARFIVLKPRLAKLLALTDEASG